LVLKRATWVLKRAVVTWLNYLVKTDSTFSNQHS